MQVCRRYYGYRLGSGAEQQLDPRLAAMQRCWFEGRRCLDVGCNEAVVTLQARHVSLPMTAGPYAGLCLTVCMLLSRCSTWSAVSFMSPMAVQDRHVCHPFHSMSHDDDDAYSTSGSGCFALMHNNICVRHVYTCPATSHISVLAYVMDNAGSTQ